MITTKLEKKDTHNIDRNRFVRGWLDGDISDKSMREVLGLDE